MERRNVFKEFSWERDGNGDGAKYLSEYPKADYFIDVFNDETR